MNYKSPIESFSYIDQIIEWVKDEFDNNVYKAVLRAGVQVDKSELIRALQYDRDQYLKGYSDAKQNMIEALLVGLVLTIL